MSHLALGLETAVARGMAFKHRQGYVTCKNTNSVRTHLPLGCVSSQSSGWYINHFQWLSGSFQFILFLNSIYYCICMVCIWVSMWRLGDASIGSVLPSHFYIGPRE